METVTVDKPVILVVDDEREVRLALRKTLEQRAIKSPRRRTVLRDWLS